jgi:hypothetical protein
MSSVARSSKLFNKSLSWKLGPFGRRTPQVTIEAILHCVRERGTAALKEPANIERLRRCDPAAIAQIDARLKR